MCPTEHIFEPLLFFLHINDIFLDKKYEIRFFVSDCDRYREIKDIEDTLNLQEGIERLGSWAENWVRDFKVKCNMMQLIIRRNKIHALFTLYTRGYSSLEF